MIQNKKDREGKDFNINGVHPMYHSENDNTKEERSNKGNEVKREVNQKIK